MKNIDQKSHIALYHQLKLIFFNKILNNEWQKGEKIPNEFDLCNEYDVSRITVRQALSELEKEGYLNRRQGKGTFVSIPKIEQNLTSFYSFTEEFKKKGYTPTSKVLSFESFKADNDISEKLDLKTEPKYVFCFKRARYADNIVFAVETTYLPACVFPELNKNLLNERPLYDIMRDMYGKVPVSAQEFFGCILSDDVNSKYLGVKAGSACMEIERTTFSNDMCIEYTKGIIRGDMFRFSVKLDK